MFSDSIKNLRNAAQATTKSNGELLAEMTRNGVLKDPFHKANKSIENGKVLSMIMGGGGITGLVGVGASFQAMSMTAAGVASASTSLASIGTLLTGLGTVAVGGAILPVATVVTIGAAVAGVAGLAITSLRTVDYAALEVDRDKAIWNNNRNPNGHDSKIGIKNWFQGAKNLISENINDIKSKYTGNSVDMLSASIKAKDYNRAEKLLDANPKLIHELNSKGTSVLGMAIAAKNPNLVQKILNAGADINAPINSRLGINSAKEFANKLGDKEVVEQILNHQNKLLSKDPFDDIMDKYEEAMNAKGMFGVVQLPNKELGQYAGSVVAINDSFVIQSIGRSSILHNRTDLNNLNIKIGQSLDVKYKAGQVLTNNNQQQSVER